MDSVIAETHFKDMHENFVTFFCKRFKGKIRQTYQKSEKNFKKAEKNKKIYKTQEKPTNISKKR